MKGLIGILRRSERGVTLVEMAIVLAIIGILAAVAVPNLGGFLGAGAKQSFDGDKSALQTAVDAFRSDSNNIGGLYPTIGALDDLSTNDCANGKGTFGSTDTLGATCAAYVDIAALVDGHGSIVGGFLSSTAGVKSADVNKNTTATSAGSYGWYITSAGQVAADPAFTEGVYP